MLWEIRIIDTDTVKDLKDEFHMLMCEATQNDVLSPVEAATNDVRTQDWVSVSNFFTIKSNLGKNLIT